MGGGGVYTTGARVEIRRSTITGNTGPLGGGGVYAEHQGIITSSTITGTVVSGGWNVVSDSTCGFTQPTDRHGVPVLLGNLVDNGGPTLTQLVAATGAAIDLIPFGTPGLCPRPRHQPHPHHQVTQTSPPCVSRHRRLTVGDESKARPVGSEGVENQVRALYPMIVAIVRAHTSSREVAEDIAQEVMVRYWMHAPRVDHPTAWTYRCALNLSNSWLRRHRRDRVLEHDIRAALPDDGGNPASNVASDLLAALEQLPRRQREAVVLSYLCDLHLHDVALVMRISEGSVKSHLSRGLRALRSSPYLQTVDIPTIYPGR